MVNDYLLSLLDNYTIYPFSMILLDASHKNCLLISLVVCQLIVIHIL